MKNQSTILEQAQEKATDFIKGLKSDIDIIYHVDVENLDLENPDGVYDQIREQLDEANAFDEEIIYYSRAMEFLTEHDTSLRRSLEIAQDMGYEPKNLSSETLASLLAGEVNREDFSDLESKITDFFTELAEWISEEQEKEEA